MNKALLVALAILIAAGSAMAAPSACGTMSLQDLISRSSAAGSASGANNGCVISYGNVSYKFDYFSFTDTGSSTALSARDIQVSTRVGANGSAVFDYSYTGNWTGQFDTAYVNSSSNLQQIKFDLGFRLVAITGNRTGAGMQLGADAYVMNGGFNLSRTVTPQGGSGQNSAIFAPGSSLFQTGNTGMFGAATSQFAVVNRFNLTNNGDMGAMAMVQYFRNTFLFNDIQVVPPPDPVSPTPEPSTMALVGIAAGGLMWWRRRRT